MGEATTLLQKSTGKTLVAFPPVRTLTLTTKLESEIKMMKKEEEQQKAQLKWRLANKPTLEDVTTLLAKEVITKDEARQMLFSEEKPLTRDETIKALQEQVDFQKSVIEKLMEKPAPVVWGYINTYTPRYNWNGLPYTQPVVLTSSLNKNLMSTITAGSTGTTGTTTAYYAVNNGSTGKSSSVIDC